MAQPKKKKPKKKPVKPKNEPVAPMPAAAVPTAPVGDFLQRFGLKQRSKTSIDLPLRRESQDEAIFERRPSSFRRRINSFIQNNSPFLKRATSNLNRNDSLRHDISRLSDSLDSLKIKEDQVLAPAKPLDARIDLLTRKEKCKSLDFRTSLQSLTEEIQENHCEPKRKIGFIQRSTSMSTSLHFVPAWLSGGKHATISTNTSHNIIDDTRSRSLTHIDKLEVGSPEFIRDMNDRPQELLVPSVKRPTLTRSQASSSECFTVGFEGLSEDTPDEYVPASNEIVLKDALLEVCKRKSVDLSLSSVYLDVNKSPLPCLDIDTSWMGGKHIRIKVNDRVVRWEGRNALGTSTPLRKISSTHKTGKTGLRTQNVSSEEPSVAESASGVKTKRWSGFFGTSKDTTRMETLVDLLDSYNKTGIPGAQETVDYEGIYHLESDWKNIVHNASNLDEPQSQQQEALWELIRSELDYIRMLRVVCHLFLSCLKNLQTNQLLLEIDNKKLFSNIEEICKCNEGFWEQTILPVLQESRRSGERLNPELFRDGFCRFSSSFQCYTAYCAQQASCQSYCREKLTQEQDHEVFTAYLAWCETQKECNRLKLLDILVKPMQRLTKYSLLLKAVLKHSSPSQQEVLLTMVRHVDEFVNHVNSTLKRNYELQQLRQLASKLESYDVVETKDDDLAHLLHKYAMLSLTDLIPSTDHHRCLLFESDLKFKDASAKMEVHCFLLTDMLLITKAIKRLGEPRVKYKVIRQPFAVDRLITQEMAREPPSLGCVYLNQYNTAVTAFILSCSEPDLIKNWTESIRKARAQLSQLLNAQSISRQMSEDANEPDEYKPVWTCPSPRGSSRVSSLAHSHSGSMEMTENISSMSSVSRGISVENTSDHRASSQSSEDGNPSPRPHKSPNTLTVHIPHLGQSLPNLSTASTSPNSPRPPNSLYLAPPKALSPTHRGVSYPPPSPPRGSLRRGLAISPRNPPLLKTSRVELSRSLSIAQDASAKGEKWECGLLKPRSPRLSRSEKRSEDPKKKETIKAVASGGAAHLSVSSIHSSSGFSSAASSNEGLSTVKFGEILEMVSQEPDKSPLELFESKVEQWRQFGFTGRGDDDDHPVFAPLRPRRSRSFHVTSVNPCQKIQSKRSSSC